MEFQSLVRARRMVRRYRPDPVDPDVLRRILDTARMGPSAGFSQPQRFVVVTDQEVRRQIAEACGEPEAVRRGLPRWLSVAPVHVVPCVRRMSYVERYAEPDKPASGGPDVWTVPYWWVDGGAMLMLLLLAARDEGLDAGFLDIEPGALGGAVEIPDDWTPLGLVTLGHRAQDSRAVGSAVRRARLPLEAVVDWHMGD